jgi:hypothetical protein
MVESESTTDKYCEGDYNLKKPKAWHGVFCAETISSDTRNDQKHFTPVFLDCVKEFSPLLRHSAGCFLALYTAVFASPSLYATITWRLSSLSSYCGRVTSICSHLERRPIHRACSVIRRSWHTRWKGTLAQSIFGFAGTQYIDGIEAHVANCGGKSFEPATPIITGSAVRSVALRSTSH